MRFWILLFVALLVAVGVFVWSGAGDPEVVKLEAGMIKPEADVVKLEANVVRDKIKGGWVGQTVGCTYGGPTEFRWTGTWIPDSVPIEWDETRMLWYYENSPDLYDDVYMI